jgi:FlaA1/EpsC-like NDP-sugar epimerase
VASSEFDLPRRTIATRAAKLRSDLTFAALDAAVVVCAYVLVLVFRLGGTVSPDAWHEARVYIPLALAAHIIANAGFGLYGRMWRYASVDEARRVLGASIAAGVVLWATRLLNIVATPRSVLALGLPIATLLIGAIRFRSRLFALQRTGDRGFGLRVAVLGAGESGASIIKEMLNRPTSGLLPVLVLDDDPRLHGRLIAGVPVVGRLDELEQVAEQFRVHQALLAIPSGDRQVVQRAAAAAEAANVALKVLPGVADLVGGRPSLRSARDLNIEDLLGREQVVTDLVAVRALLHNRRVLITGAGGSIGAELARQVDACEPSELVLLDHDETHLQDVAATLTGPFQLVLTDIRDRDAVSRVFSRALPEVVFHAAAHKHVDLLEDHPIEAFRTNVMGSLNVVDAALASAASTFVYISTDKAVRAQSVMGASKHVGGQVVLTKSPPGARYCVVRFGNVLGSRGSVIPIFARQIAAGGPVRVTDPRMTRFFMSVTEAVQLVLQAAVLADGGDAFMLEMGEAVNILDLAKRMIRLSGHNVGTDIPILITGPRPGEKLHEELITAEEVVLDRPHPSIIRLAQADVPWATLEQRVERLTAAAAQQDGDAVRDELLGTSHALTDMQGRPSRVMANTGGSSGTS